MISLVVIGRNESFNLFRTFNSLDLNQFSEIFFVDCSSTDDSVNIVQKNFKSVNIISLKSNYYSASLARFVGLKYVTSEYVQFLDGDQTLNLDWIEKGYNFLKNNKKVAIVHGYKYEYKDKNDLQNYSVKKDKFNFQSDYLQGSYMARTKVLKESGFYDIRMVGEEERDLYVRIKRLGYQVWYLDYLMSSHYDFKLRGLKYILFSPVSVVILFPLFKYINSKFIFSYIYVYRYLLPQLIIDLLTIYTIFFIPNITFLLMVLLAQILSLIFYLRISRKGYWIIWKSAILNILRIFSLINKKVIYSHKKI